MRSPIETTVNPLKISKRTTAQAIKDYEKVIERVQKAGPKLDSVISRLQNIYGLHLTAYSLLKHANKLCDQLGLNIDRLATRNRKALFCWFAENWNYIEKYLPDSGCRDHLHCVQSQNYHCSIVDLTDIKSLLKVH